MRVWEQFEALVGAIHRALNASDYSVETNVVVEEPSGARHQVDVVLKPKTPFSGPILISCKAWASPVDVKHVREWSDIVQHTGAAAGVIVAQSGFTSPAIDVARNIERRVSLWQPRRLHIEDFAPDLDSGTGYISRVVTRGIFSEPRLVENSLEIDAERADGQDKRGQVEYRFSAAHRPQWYLRDAQDNVVENLWDVYTSRAVACTESQTVEFAPEEPRFLVLGGIRLRLKRFAFRVEVLRHEQTIEVDMLTHAMAYLNVITQQIKIVPLSQLGQLGRMVLSERP